jgi:FkbM family methyltransferase
MRSHGGVGKRRHANGAVCSNEWKGLTCASTMLIVSRTDSDGFAVRRDRRSLPQSLDMGEGRHVFVSLFAKLASRQWLKESISGRVREFVGSWTFVPSIFERDVAGEKHRFYLGNATGKSWYGSSNDASPELSFVKDHMLKPGAIVIECGAHHGAQTILLSRWVGDGGRVIAIEPMPENVAIFRRNIELNSLSNVTVVEKAAGSTCGYVSMDQKSNSRVSPKHYEGDMREGVESVTLDALAAELDIRPSFVKIDVEGYEYQVLEGSSAILSTHPAIFVEVHTLALSRYGKRFEDLWDLVDPSFYDVFLQARDADKPVRYSPGTAVGGRVHLFFKPRQQV